MNAPILNKFDLLNAQKLCLASASAYAHVDIVSPDHETAAAVYQNETDIFIAFRGTRDVKNWLTDLECEYDLLDGCEIHRGFNRALDSIFKSLNDYAFQPGYKSRRIWLTGHSLGGAIAMLYAWRYFTEFHDCPFSGIYTFGQPRVGNKTFSVLYDYSGLKSRTFRAIHADDIIPRVPWLLGGYRHAGHEVFFTGGNGGNREAVPNLIQSHSGLVPRTSSVASVPSCSISGNFLFDPSVPAKLPWDLRNAWRELAQGKLALMADHHIDSYKALFPPPAPKLPTEGASVKSLVQTLPA